MIFNRSPRNYAVSVFLLLTCALSFTLAQPAQQVDAAGSRLDDYPVCSRYEDLEVKNTGCNDVQIVILIDDSASMLTNDPKGIRFDGVVELLDILADTYLDAVSDEALNLPGLRVATVHFGSVVGFKSEWQTIAPQSIDEWTSQRTQIARDLKITKETRNYAATNFIDPFNAAKALFTTAPALAATDCRNEVILLLTDGTPSTDLVKTQDQIEQHLEEVGEIAAEIFEDRERSIFVTALRAGGSDDWALTEKYWNEITQNQADFPVPRVLEVPNAQTLAGRISQIVAEEVGLKNVFLGLTRTATIPPNVRMLRVTYFTPDANAQLTVRDPNGSVYRSNAGTLPHVFNIPIKVQGTYTFEPTDDATSINLIFKYPDQIKKYVPPNLSRVTFAFSVNPDNARPVAPGEVLFTVDQPATGKVYEATIDSDIHIVEISNPISGVYVLNGSLSDGALATVFDYPRKSIRITRPESDGAGQLQQFTESQIRFLVSDYSAQPMEFSDSVRFLAVYSLPGDPVPRSEWVALEDSAFSLTVLPEQPGAGKLRLLALSTDLNGNDCLLHKSGEMSLVVDPITVRPEQAPAEQVCVPIGLPFNNAIVLEVINDRTKQTAGISLPLKWQASASADDGQPVGLILSEEDALLTIHIVPGGLANVQTRVRLDVIAENGNVPVYEASFSTGGLVQNDILDFQITGIDWRADNLTHPFYRFLYEISGTSGEEIMTRYKFFKWRLPTKSSDSAGNAFGSMLFGYRVMGWFGPDELEVRAAFNEDAAAGMPAALEQFRVKMIEIQGLGQETAEPRFSNDWERLSTGEYRVTFPAPDGSTRVTRAYAFSLEYTGEDIPCTTIAPSIQRNALIVIPYWGTIAATLLGSLHIPRLVRWSRRKYSECRFVEDDLTIIEGIGPKVQTALKYELGIFTYAQLAQVEIPELEAWLDGKKWDYMYPNYWPIQASLAAVGRFEDLETLKKILFRGRVTDQTDAREVEMVMQRVFGAMAKSKKRP